jgi:hypothetical protein
VEACRIRRVSSELSISFVESNGAFKFAARIQNTNFTGPKARAGFRIVNRPTFLQEDRLNAWSLEDFPAPTVWPDFNQRHRVSPSSLCV